MLAGASGLRPAGLWAQSPPLRIYRAVKVSMIQGDLSVMEQFKLAKECGFDGISLFAPDRFDPKEVLRAQDATGLRIHNVNNAVHWQIRLSDPEPEVRQESLKAMKQTLRFAHRVGAASILQVVGKVTDSNRENHDQVWERSIEQIRQAIPLAAHLGVRILCENVGNGFCMDAQRWAEYLDEIGNPWVGAVFDIGNHDEYRGAPHWIRTLGPRIVKLDVKGHDSKTHRNCPIFEGDLDWPAVRAELKKLRFSGWATAEVRGGGRERLAEVASRMKEALTSAG
jgi:hexulose-6-phosphate isomerase